MLLSLETLEGFPHPIGFLLQLFLLLLHLFLLLLQLFLLLLQLFLLLFLFLQAKQEEIGVSASNRGGRVLFEQQLKRRGPVYPFLLLLLLLPLLLLFLLQPTEDLLSVLLQLSLPFLQRINQKKTSSVSEQLCCCCSMYIAG